MTEQKTELVPTDNSLCFGGQQQRYRHYADTLKCDMDFSVYLPPQANRQQVPALYWLSGLTCTDQNFVTKAGAQRYAAKHGIALVVPDTSPRGDHIPDDSQADYDLGLGAGFYVNATQAPWQENYHMYDYINDELPTLINTHFPIDATRSAISGHSMGGHGAITIALKNPQRYQSVSAFAPISSPLNCPWGDKALTAYLGADRETWHAYDSCDLIRSAQHLIPMRVDQGDADTFLSEQLKPELLLEAAKERDYPLRFFMQAGYDHSYYFISSFIGQHIAFHAEHLH